MSYELEYVETLKKYMNDVLQQVVQTFGQAEIDLPERHYIAMGQTAHDCEQVTVSFIQAYAGLPGDQATQPLPCDGPRSAVVSVEIVRCIPVPATRATKPTIESMQTMAEKQAIDAWMLLESGMSFHSWSGALADVAVSPAEGGFQAVTMTLTAAM